MTEPLRDVFLSHSSKDKDLYVRPFAKELDKFDFTYWLDEAEIKWADKITKKINEGLQNSKFVIVFLSENFINSSWASNELETALNKENSTGQKVVLPIIIGEPDKILDHFQLLRDKIYLKWNGEPASIVEQLLELFPGKKSSTKLKPKTKPKPELKPMPEPEPERETLVENPSLRISTLLSAIVKNENDYKAYAELGEVYLGQKEWAKAVEAYQKAISLNSNVGLWHYNLGVSFLNSSSIAEAEASFYNAVKLNPNNVNFRETLAELLAETGKWDQAVAQLTDLKELKPSDKEIKARLDRALKEQDKLISEYYLKGIKLENIHPGEAKEYFQRVYDNNPNYQDVRARLAALITKLWHKAEKEKLSDAEKHAYQAISYLEKNKISEAKTEVSKISSENALYHDLMGKIYFKQKNWDEAEKAFNQALKMGSGNVFRYNELGRIAIERKQWNKAEEYFESALKLEPNDLISLFNLTLVRKEKQEIAREAFNNKTSTKFFRSLDNIIRTISDFFLDHYIFVGIILAVTALIAYMLYRWLF